MELKIETLVLKVLSLSLSTVHANSHYLESYKKQYKTNKSVQGRKQVDIWRGVHDRFCKCYSENKMALDFPITY